MQQSELTKVKVHNEIELCETSDMDAKQVIERILLQNRISYCIKWKKQGFFWNSHDNCIFCVNDNASSEAIALIEELDDDTYSKIRVIMQKSPERYF